MATIKSYTDLLQSKVLAEILPLESADMYYCYGMDIHTKKCGYDIVPTIIDADNQIDICDIPCWSLAALLGTLTENKICHYNDRYYCQYMSKGDEFPIYSTAEYNNPIDACVEMIEKLHELKML